MMLRLTYAYPLPLQPTLPLLTNPRANLIRAIAIPPGNAKVILIILIIATARKRIIQLAAARAPAGLGGGGTGDNLFATGAAAAVAGEPLALFLVEELKLVALARVVAQAAAARHPQVDAEAGAKGDDEGEGAVDPGLGGGRDAEVGEE